MILEILDLLGALFLFAGSALALVAAIALVRFPDVLCKMHAITKPQVLGLLFVATGLALTFRIWWVFAVCTLIVALQLITSPVSATMVSRSAYRTGLMAGEIMVMDELSEDLSLAGYRFQESEEEATTEPFADEEASPERPDLLLDQLHEPVMAPPSDMADHIFEGGDEGPSKAPEGGSEGPGRTPPRQTR